jgi:hypothetical protein
LIELARQFVRDNNGRLLASSAYLAKRGWTSSDVIARAKRELLDGGFIFETVKGHRPNKASWYAVTWLELDRLQGYDPGAATGFERSAYLKAQPMRNASLSPSGGVGRPAVAPSGGVEKAPPTPFDGAMRATLGAAPTPSGGHHLESHLESLVAKAGLI